MFGNYSNHVTYYDAATKIWSGSKAKRYYDRNLSFGRIAFEEMRRRPNKICQISDSEKTELTNSEVLLQAIRVARYFETQNIQQSDIIGIIGRNTTYLMGVLVGCFFHGCAYHALNPGFDKDKTKELLFITKPKIIFCDGQDYVKIKAASEGLETKIITLSNHIEGVTGIFDLLLPVARDEGNYRPVDLKDGPEQNLAILCSSGSTATPKAVTIPNTTRVYELNFLTEDDVQYVPSTMDWLSGFVSIASSIVYGTLRIITDAPFTPEYCLELYAKYKVTFTVHSPPSMALIAKSPRASPEALASMRNFYFGGSKCAISVQNAMQSLLRNGRIVFVYGFTELFGLLAKNVDCIAKPNSVGRISPGYKIKIVDTNGKALGPGQTGELLVYQEEMWAGYYGNSKESRAMRDSDGWYHTGDLGYFDEDHYLYIAGRLKEMLKYRGIQFYPSDIEDIIAKMPTVKEVCVFGVFDDLIGDAATAAVVALDGRTLTAQDVVDFVRSNAEVDYKLLHGGAIIVKELPKTGSGKMDRRATKQLFLDTKNNNLKC